MQHITGISRHQMRISSLEDATTPDNLVRFIDAFVGSVAFGIRFIFGFSKLTKNEY